MDKSSNNRPRSSWWIQIKIKFDSSFVNMIIFMGIMIPSRKIDIRFLSNLHCRSLKVGFSEYFFIIQKWNSQYEIFWIFDFFHQFYKEWENSMSWSRWAIRMVARKLSRCWNIQWYRFVAHYRQSMVFYVIIRVL